MKKFLSICLFIIVSNCYAQPCYKDILTKFYSRIDSTHRLQCCDTGAPRYYLGVKLPLYELPIFDRLDLKEYETQIMSGFDDILANDLVDFYEKINPKLRKKFTKSCYVIEESYKVDKYNEASGIFWVEGTLTVRIYFQSDNPRDALPWYRRIFYKPKQ